MGRGRANPTNYCHHQNEFCFEVRVKQTHSNGTDHCVMICQSDSDSLFTKLYNKESVSKGGKHTDVSKGQHGHASARYTFLKLYLLKTIFISLVQ